MKHLGDITQLKGNKIPKVDIITGGSPCQDLSVAGKREGLAGERSGLFMEQIRIIKEMREHDRANGRTDVDIRPRYMVWENVPGAFSSNKGEDFRCVLEETAKIADSNATIPRLKEDRNGKQKWSKAGAILGDGWSIAWRVHDAQFWGVPQRRKRISLVADFGGETAPEILFERKGVSGNITESGKEREGIAKDVRAGVEETGKYLNSWDVQSKHIQPENGISEALYSGECRGGGGESYVLQSRVYGISAYDSNAMKSSNPHSGVYEADTTRTLDNNGGNPACNQGGMAIVQSAGVDTYNQTIDEELAQPLRAADGGDSTPKVVCIEGNGQRESHKGDGYKESDTMYTLNTVEQHAVCIENHPADSRVKIAEDGICQTLSGRMGTGGGNVPMVMEPEPITASKASYFMKQHDDGVAETLVATDYKDPQLVAYGLDRASYNQGQNAQYNFSVDEEKVGTCVAKGPNAVCKAVDCLNGREKDVNGTLAADARKSLNSGNVVRCESVVRRLTPMECERLQGFPDHWTDIGEWVDSKGKKHKNADSPRYKALGNSIALPFWEWMAKRMVRLIKNDEPTMASLFDGIGGFPLVFSRCGCTPVWASEIEEFPIAVTKIRFKEEVET